MDTNPTTDHLFRNAALVVIIACAAVFVIRSAMYAIPLFQALAK